MAATWTDSDRRFARRVVRRRRLFLWLAAIGVLAATGLAGYYGYRIWRGGPEAPGIRVALVVLVLLNARQNLRQYRYARLLELVVDSSDGGAGSEAPE